MNNIVKNEKYDYSKLDDNGIVRENEYVDDTTVSVSYTHLTLPTMELV